jgi:hypothetical protein
MCILTVLQTLLIVVVTWLRQMYDSPNFSISSFTLRVVCAVHKNSYCVSLVMCNKRKLYFANLCIIFRLQVSVPNSNSATWFALHKWRWWPRGSGVTKVQNTKICYGFLSSGFLPTEGSIQNSVTRSESNFADNYKLSHPCRIAWWGGGGCWLWSLG